MSSTELSRRGLGKATARLLAGVAAATKIPVAATVRPPLTEIPAPGITPTPDTSINQETMGIVTRFVNLACEEDSAYDMDIFGSLLTPFSEAGEIDEKAKRIITGDFTGNFDERTYFSLENFWEGLVRISKKGISRAEIMEMFCQDPYLMKGALTGVDYPTGCVDALNRVPGVFEELFGVDRSIDEIIELVEERSGEGILIALDRGLIPLGGWEYRTILNFAYKCLPKAHPRHHEILEALDTVRETQRKFDELEEKETRKKLEELRKKEKSITQRKENTADTKILCILAESKPIEGWKVFAVTTTGRVAIADIDNVLKNAKIFGGTRYRPHSRLRIGKNYRLQQEGAHCVKIITKFDALIGYLTGRNGSIEIPTRRPVSICEPAEEPAAKLS